MSSVACSISYCSEPGRWRGVDRRAMTRNPESARSCSTSRLPRDTPWAKLASAQAAQAAAQANSSGSGGSSGGGGGSINLRPPPPTSSGAAGAVQAAQGEIGVPYAWGGASFSTGFDCSGLIMWAYAQVGIGLPHFSGHSTTTPPIFRWPISHLVTSCSTVPAGVTTKPCTSAGA